MLDLARYAVVDRPVLRDVWSIIRIFQVWPDLLRMSPAIFGTLAGGLIHSRHRPREE